MIVEVYQYKDLALYIKDNYLEIVYFGAKYSEEINGTIVETICSLLNRISNNNNHMYEEIRGMICFTELSNTQTINFDGTKYFIENVKRI